VHCIIICVVPTSVKVSPGFALPETDGGSPPAILLDVNPKHLHALFDCVSGESLTPCILDPDIAPENVIQLANKYSCEALLKRLLATYPDVQERQGKVMYQFMSSEECKVLELQNEEAWPCYYCRLVIRSTKIETPCIFHPDPKPVQETRDGTIETVFPCCGSLRHHTGCKTQTRHYKQRV